MIADNSDSTAPSLPAPKGKLSVESKLLIAEAKETCRSENQTPIRRWTGERLAKERPRLHRLVLAMLSEGLSIRAIRRATLVDARTIKSVELTAAKSMPTLKRELAGTTARVAKRTIERIEEEIDTLPPNLLGMVYGIAVDKLANLTGEANLRIEHTIQDNRGNIFDRMAELQTKLQQAAEKVIQAKVVEPEPMQLQEQT